jgi:NADPH:quinone reductase-like Zn-dependent oxidoreductase
MRVVDSTEKLDLMLSMGFDHVIDYTSEDFTKNKEQYDVILDNKINRSLSHYGRALAPNGKYVTTGGATGKILQLFLFGWNKTCHRGQFWIRRNSAGLPVFRRGPP